MGLEIGYVISDLGSVGFWFLPMGISKETPLRIALGDDDDEEDDDGCDGDDDDCVDDADDESVDATGTGDR